MAILSRSGSLVLLLVLNAIMFFAEIIVGYKTSSLALIADAFHMLSDVLAQMIALYAIRLAAKTEWQPTLSYGWQRAELLGALYNGVFLLALCFSLLLDAVERFFNPQDIEDPVLVLIVGGIGLACNLLGLVLFHDHAGHGHSHGNGHSHIHGKESTTEQQQITAQAPAPAEMFETDLSSNDISDPEKSNLRYQSSPLKETNLQNLQQAALEVQKQLEDEKRYVKEEGSSETRQSLPIQDLGDARPNTVVVSMDDEDHGSHDHDHSADHHDDHTGHVHHSHNHDSNVTKGTQPSGEDLNMKSIFLHVFGDALGSIGVIFTALFIWKTDFSWRFYLDPVVSLFITAIIIHSALPLVRSASFILLQGVPVGVEIEEIRKEIRAIPDVISIHDLHIWQLTNIKMVASLHVLVTNQEAFARVSRAIKIIMHHAGVHSTTIQPEFPGMHPALSQADRSNNSLRHRKFLSEEEAHNLLQNGELGSRASSVGAQSNEFLPGTPAQANSPVVLSPGHQSTADESNCALLCVDGEQACDIGSCCSPPVKR